MTPLDLARGPLEIAVNRYLGADPQALADITALGGDGLNLELVELGWRFSLRPVSHGLQLGPSLDAPQAQVRTSLAAIGRVLAGEAPTALGDKLRIDGDAEYAQSLLRILRQADFDLEGELERALGPAAAQQLGQGLRQAVRAGRRGLEVLFGGGVAALRENDLVPAGELESWMDAVDALVADTDRAAARIERLREGLG